MSISPSKWGKSFWNTLHWIAAGYPDAPSDPEILAANRLMLSLEYLIPCEECRKHYSEYLVANPVQLNTGDALRVYLMELHNHVNRLTQVTPEIWDKTRLYREYDKQDKQDKQVPTVRQRNRPVVTIQTMGGIIMNVPPTHEPLASIGQPRVRNTAQVVRKDLLPPPKKKSCGCQRPK